MDYYDDAANVDRYIEAARGFDGADLIRVLSEFLEAGSSVLELGMGPGKDVALLGERFAVTGSDRSPVFVDRYRRDHPGADVLLLDAVTIDTDRRFDCVYSNKVLHHLSDAELAQSLERQSRVLNPDGVAMHSFWYGSGEEDFHGLRSVSRTEDDLRRLLSPSFDVLKMERYREFEDGDSIYVLAKLKRPDPA